MANTDNLIDIPWNIKAIGASDLWEVANGGEGIVTAVIDSGCDIYHPDLRFNIIDHYNFTNKNDFSDVTDNLGHGTHVSGIIASKNHSRKTIGVAPNSKLLILKAFDNFKNESFKTVIKAIEFSINWTNEKGQRVNIINLSLGSKKSSNKLKKVIKKALSKNILIVSASGNFGKDKTRSKFLYPGKYSGVINVGALDMDLKTAPFSIGDKSINFLAPGVNILSTFPQNRYGYESGTSMAAPHLSGLLALLLKLYSPVQVRKSIKEKYSMGFLKSNSLYRFITN